MVDPERWQYLEPLRTSSHEGDLPTPVACGDTPNWNQLMSFSFGGRFLHLYQVFVKQTTTKLCPNDILGSTHSTILCKGRHILVLLKFNLSFIVLY